MTGNHHLGNPFPWNNLEGFIGEVNKDDLYLSPVIRVNGARGIQDGDSVLCRKAAARPYLGLIARRKGNVKASWDKRPFKGADCNGGFKICPEVHPGALRRSIGRAGMAGFINNPDFHLFRCFYIQYYGNYRVYIVWQPYGY